MGCPQELVGQAEHLPVLLFQIHQQIHEWNAASPRVPIPYSDGRLDTARRIPEPLATSCPSRFFTPSFKSRILLRVMEKPSKSFWIVSCFFVSVLILVSLRHFVNDFTFSDAFSPLRILCYCVFVHIHNTITI